jgi:isopentenyl diphosphate isomerase/L-lactate dehydrogenase-like FMN-dependent dehydrogenase
MPLKPLPWLRCARALTPLRQYEAAFRDNEIDETVLPNLTAEDLKELSVTALGHRCKLPDAMLVCTGTRAARCHALAENSV